MSFINKLLLFEHFAGRTSPLQKKLIAEWLQTEANREQFYTWLTEWETIYPLYDPEISAPLERFTTYMRDPHMTTTVPSEKPSNRKVVFTTFHYATAAILLLAVLAGWLGHDQLLYEQYRTGFGKTSAVVLPDGTCVTLNANSVLRVPRWSFGSIHRNVYLEGEAEFAVKHMPDHQLFQVHTMDNSLVTVLGTEFIVYTRDELTNVTLNKGKVRLSPHAGNKSHTMQPGERATIAVSGEIMIEKLNSKQLEAGLAWKEHHFVFDNTPLTKVAERIQEVFGVEVQITDKNLALRTATGSYPAESAEELLKNLSVMYSFEIVKNKKQIQIIPIP